MGTYKQLERIELRKKEELAKTTPLFNVNATFDKVFPKMIDAIYNESVNQVTLGLAHRNFSLINDVFKKSSKEEKKICYDFLIGLHKKKLHKILEDTNFISAIIQLMTLCLFWIRDCNDWDKKSYNSEKQISSLLRFLLCSYDVPEFLNGAFYNTSSNPVSRYSTTIYVGKPNYIDWFMHLGEGKNARDLKGLPIKFTKKMAHAFINTPDHYQIGEAVKRAQIIGIGGDETMVYSILGSRIGSGFVDDDFWVTVIQFFINTPMLNPDVISPIIDFIHHQKFEYMRTQLLGVYTSTPPPQPNFCIKGRTIQKLIEDTEGWHNELNKAKKRSNYSEWKPVGIKEYEDTEGQIGERSFKMYTIREILNSTDLQAEGRAMKHCVYSYVGSCARGDCSIWSLSVNYDRLVTIEVRNRTGDIVQVRARYNKRATQKDTLLIKRWASLSGLKVLPQAF